MSKKIIGVSCFHILSFQSLECLETHYKKKNPTIHPSRIVKIMGEQARQPDFQGGTLLNKYSYSPTQSWLEWEKLHLFTQTILVCRWQPACHTNIFIILYINQKNLTHLNRTTILKQHSVVITNKILTASSTIIRYVNKTICLGFSKANSPISNLKVDEGQTPCHDKMHFYVLCYELSPQNTKESENNWYMKTTVTSNNG